MVCGWPEESFVLVSLDVEFCLLVGCFRSASCVVSVHAGVCDCLSFDCVRCVVGGDICSCGCGGCNFSSG